MAKTAVVVAVAAVALFLLAGTSVAAVQKMFVEGKVYCDPCRIEFPVKISTMLPGAKVNLQCRDRANQTTTYEVEGVTDKTGKYRLPVVADHEEDICEVKLLGSPEADCNEQFKFIDRARVLLTGNMGVTQSTRYANAIGYMKSTTDPRCAKILQEMGMNLHEAQTKFINLI
ncbi:Olee1-like protein [Linum grandiflorum]